MHSLILFLILTYIQRKAKNKYLNFIPTFANLHESICGSNLGSSEPLNYPASYLVDEHYPVIDAETNTVSIQ